ncbi:MAG: adenylate/guanylate cyclase domain-containing protein [Desulfobacterales bacterium]|nr:adenylate/guanylate cyclase domain-containing protein [Desulfobacterales bacterium]
MPSDDKYKFSHDRVQQAVYSLIPKEDQPQIHLSIGKLLEAKYLKQDDDHFLFDIVNHLNIGSPLVAVATEKINLARLNERAAKKAMASSAFKPAFDYVSQGIELLPEDAWSSHYELNLSLHYLGAEAAYDIAEFEPMTQYIDAVLMHGKVMMDKIPVYALRINAFKASNKLDEAIDAGLEVLEKMGEKIPRKGPLPLVMIDLLKTKFMLRGKKKEDILKLPIMENQEKRAALRILNDIASPVYWARPAILPFVIFRMVQLSLRYGITEISAFGFATYGLLMCGVLGDMPEGYRFGQIGLALLEKFKAKKWLSQIYTPIYALINHWSEHIHQSLEPFLYSYRVGFETGAIEYACINVNIYCNHLYLGGKPLVQTEEEMCAFSESMLAFKQETNYNYNEAYRQAVLNLLGKSEDVLLLIGSAFDETKMAIQNTERNDRAGDFHIHFHKMILNYLFRNYEEARVQADLGRPLLDAVLAKFDVAVFHFYEGLVYLALAGETSSKEQRRLLSRPNKNIKQFKKWAKYSPDNHSHKLSLLEAERYRVAGKDKEAKESYDKAVAGANKQNFLNEEALACERAGMFYEARGIESLTGHFIKLAFQAYREWGAQAKLNDLQSRYYDLTNEIKQSKKLGSNISLSSTIETDSAIDLQSVIKAATTISQEIVLAKLLKQMMLIVMENAGAQRGSMFLHERGKWVLRATGNIEHDEVEVLQGKPLDGSVEVPITIIQYVARSNEEVVLENAMSATRFQADTYILENKPKSVLCLPIMYQGKITSILYLENNLVTAAFTQDRIELLNLLSGQIAISIENALFYDQLEQRVKDRTTELQAEKKKSDDLLLNILPVDVADELKEFGHFKARNFEQVTVMFTDFVDFTIIAESLSPEELVAEIDTYFRGFDEIIQKNGLEKIKTIGDAYLCVSGMPETNEESVQMALQSALEMQSFVSKYNEKRMSNNQRSFELRIGIHTGPLVAGIVGVKKFAYDIWGDTVNIAARMEQNCHPGKINISEYTYKLLNDKQEAQAGQVTKKFKFQYRGKIEAKNKGKLKMYFAESV